MGVVGRDGVLADAGRLLDEGGAVLLYGPPGIGKTAVWRELRERPGDRLVLSCAPTESESALPYAALADLLEPLAALTTGLPAPQRAAVRAVLLDEDGAVAEPVDERTVAAATRSLLDLVRRPLLIAVDDAPWLDPPSARALRFALRRLRDAPALLIAQRGDDHPPSWLDRTAHPVPIGPLEAGPLHHLVRDRLGAPPSRSLLGWIARDSGGNPLLALELARAVGRLPEPPRPGDDLPVVARVRRLLADRLAALPADCRAAVRLAALLSVPTPAILAAAGVPAHALDPAEEAGLLVVTPGEIRFAHPVYAATVRASIAPGVRRRLHAALADATSDPDERARQLAHCTHGPDAGVAADLTAAAERQFARGAPDLAADLYEQALTRTPEGLIGERDARRLALARCRLASGDYAAAARAAEDAAASPAPAMRAEALLLRATVAFGADDPDTALRGALAGLTEAGDDRELAGRLHAHLAVFHDAPEPARRHAERAIALVTDPPLRSAALLLLFFHEVRAGRPARRALLAEALALEDGEPHELAATVPAIWWKSIDEHDLARARLHALLAAAGARGDERAQHELHSHLGEAELQAGRWDDAEKHITAASELGRRLGTGLVGEDWLAGLLDAYQGRLDRAESAAEAGLRRATETGDAWGRRINLQLRAFTALSAGRMAAAAADYRDLAALADAAGLADSLGLRFEADWVEACVGAGDLDAGAEVLRRLERRHAGLPRPWSELGLARGRALMAGARGEGVDETLAELAGARDRVPEQAVPFDRARCLLISGSVLRRSRRKAPARAALEAAAAEFDRLGAAAFAEKSRTEAVRVSGAARRPDTGLLSPTEERVARLAAAGHTNREIADRLFVSPKTVEANLARAYRKLAVSRRAQLGAALAGYPAVGGTGDSAGRARQVRGVTPVSGGG